MNTNEAPEKLYIYFGLPYTVDYTKLNKRSYEEEVEYTRTDAFIEKACEYLEPILTEYAGFYVGGDVLEHFMKYMKGE